MSLDTALHLRLFQGRAPSHILPHDLASFHRFYPLIPNSSLFVSFIPSAHFPHIPIVLFRPTVMLSRSSASLTSRLIARSVVHNTPPSARLAQLSSHFNTITPFQLYLRITKTNMSTYQKLNTGAKIPAIGFGTWQDVGAQEDAVLEALKAGVCAQFDGDYDLARTDGHHIVQTH